MTLEGTLPVADAVPALPRALCCRGLLYSDTSALIQAELGGMLASLVTSLDSVTSQKDMPLELKINFWCGG